MLPRVQKLKKIMILLLVFGTIRLKPLLIRIRWLLIYLGRFHGYKDGQVVYLTDFNWSVNGDVYIVSYPGTDFPNDFVKMQETEEGTILMRTEGKLFAEKQ